MHIIQPSPPKDVSFRNVLKFFDWPQPFLLCHSMLLIGYRHKGSCFGSEITISILRMFCASSHLYLLIAQASAFAICQSRQYLTEYFLKIPLAAWLSAKLRKSQVICSLYVSILSVLTIAKFQQCQ